MSSSAAARPDLRVVPAPPRTSPDVAARRVSRPAEVRSHLLAMVERFRRDQSLDVDAVFRFDVDGLTPHAVTIRDGHCVVVAGAPAHADVEIACDVDTFVDFATGMLDPIAAFRAGQFRVYGDLNLAIRLQTMFVPPADRERALVTRHTDVDGVRVESLVQGEGEPVLLLHGLGASKVSFLPTLEDLAHDHEVHALDLPGFGKSDKPLPTGRRYSARWFADVVRGYLDANGIDRAHLVGNSMGGRIALETALRHPGSVRSVTGLGPAVGFDGWQRLGRVVRTSPWEWLGMSPAVVPTAVLERGIGMLFHDPARLPEDNIRAAAHEVQLCLADRGYRMATMAAARHLAGERTFGRRGYWTRLADLAVPSLWIWGDADVLVPSRYARRVRDVVPDAQVTTWPDCGHVPQFELPERTHARIREFHAGLR